jgi:hypothetical protein
MINFFRKIRKQLADDNKPLKYMRYAVGEIILVVIGILIALSINNWNESLKEQQIEQKLLKSLKKEITTNIEHFSDRIQFHIDSKSMCVAILKQFGDSNRNTNQTILDSLVELATAPVTLNPQIGVVKSIISTGDIKYLKNELIVQFVTMFEDGIKDSTDDFNRLIGVWSSQLWPRENLYVRRMNRANANNEWLGIDLPKSGVNSDYDSFFDDIILENTYMLTLYEQTEIIKNEEELLIQMKYILDIINSELLSSN